MGQRVIVDVDDNGQITISGEGDGFLPGEVPMILDEAAARLRRVEYLQAMITALNKQEHIAEQEAQAKSAPDIVIARGTINR